MKRIAEGVLVCSLMLISVLMLNTEPARADGSMPEPPSDARFVFLKGLEGKWNVPPHGEGMPEGIFEYRVSAGGTVVEERQMTGSPMEMLTVYHMDGADLLATHYCMLNNRPHMKADTAVAGNSLAFTCTQHVGNATSHDDQHIHGWKLTLGADGGVSYMVDIFKDGQVVNSSEMKLTRLK